MAATAPYRRSATTRAELLDAAKQVIATHGVEGASVDAIAATAGRTSGSLYGQFGSKNGLVVSLLDVLGTEVAQLVREGLASATTLDERLLALWRGVAGTSDAGRDWVRLEHELWRWATSTGDQEVLRRLRVRQRAGRAGVAAVLRSWHDEGLLEQLPDAEASATAVLALLTGLEMQHRIDPDAVHDAAVVTALRALLGARVDVPARPGRPRPRRSRTTPSPSR